MRAAAGNRPAAVVRGVDDASRGDGARGVGDPGAVMYDASTNPSVILQGLQNCAVGFENRTDIAGDKGRLGAFGARACTLF